MKAAFRRSVGAARAIALAAVLAVSFAVPGQAATSTPPDVQQPYYSAPMGHTSGQVAQTFLAPKSGRLDHVSLVTATNYGARITVEILRTNSAGAPTGLPLGTSAPQSLTCCPQWHDFTFTPAVQLNGGSKYAIVVPINATYVYWYYVSSNPYPDGQMWLTFCPGCSFVSGVQYGVNYALNDFAFKVWIGTASVNSAPVVTAGGTQSTANEGTPPAMTGTFSDPDGDTVAVTADHGTLTAPTGSSSGTWSWTQPAADESPAQMITVTATDSVGLSSSITFPVNIVGVSPTALITSDPVTSPEGGTVPLTAAATSPDPADQAAGFKFLWNVTKDGNQYASGDTAAWSFQTLDEGTYEVTLQATDDGGMISPLTHLTVIGTDVTPTARITGVSASPSLVIAPQESLSFTGTFSDASLLDSHVATWDFGDGTPATTTNIPAGGSTAVAASHPYAAAGTYTVRLRVADDDGTTGETTLSLTVQTPQQALSTIAAYVQSLPGLNKGQMNSLLAKLNAASDSTGRGDTSAANNQLNAFLNELSADVNTGKVSAANAAALRASVHAVQAALGTRNRFTEWWSLAL